MSELTYRFHQVRRPGVTRDLPFGPEDLFWVTNRATLILGPTETLLVDTFTTVEQNTELVEWIRSTGRDLTTVYITHGHGDHFFGLGQLRHAFPEARFLARPGAIAEAQQQGSDAYIESFWNPLFTGAIPKQGVWPEPFEATTMEIDGIEVEVIDTGFTDTHDTSAVWVPSLRLVATGDVAYDRNHLYLAETDRSTRANWAAAAERLAELGPAAVVTGHGAGDTAAGVEALHSTATYLRDFDEIAATTSTAEALYRAMLERYPRWLNPGALWGGAKRAHPL